MKYAEVAVNTPVQKTFHYHVPPELYGQVTQGHLVRVSFGTAMQPGIVVDLHEETDIEKTKPIIELLDPQPVMTDEHIELALWLSERSLASPGQCLWLMLPPGLTGKHDKSFTLLDDTAQSDAPAQQVIIELLRESGGLRLKQIKARIRGKGIESALKKLTDAGIVQQESVLSPPTVKQKTTRTAFIDFALSDLDPILNGLKHAKKQHLIIEWLAQHDEPVDVSAVYEATGASAAQLRQLAAKGLIRLDERIIWRDMLADRDFIPRTPPPLTSGQQSVWDRIRVVIEQTESREVAATGRRRGLHIDDESEDPALVKPDPTLTLPESGEGTVSRDLDLDLNDTPGTSEESNQSNLPPLNTGEVAAAGRRRGSENYRRWKTSPELWRHLKPLAIEMRRNPTIAENYLWQALRYKRVDGYKFRRQQVIERFIVDFFCPDLKLIIEVDGEIHQFTATEDAIRQQFLEEQGFWMLRFTNQDVMQNRKAVVNAIRTAIQEYLTSDSAKSDPTLTLPAARGHSSPSGEGIIGQSEKPPLNTGEVAAAGRRRGSVFLLHGVTGSGKTEIYLRAIDLTVQQGRQAIFLVPEIALTPQTIRRVAERFPGQVAVVHGSLSTGERFDTWRRARAGEINIIVGTRSALFTPLPDIGLIVLDEEHDHSYKQSPPILPPYYHARDVAEKMMELNDGVLILGSATPDIGQYFRAEQGEITYLHLPNRIMGHRQRIEQQAQRTQIEARYSPDEGDALTIDLPPVQIVDMRYELKSGNTSMFSRDLHTALEDVIKRGEQAILFLNRRGQSTYVFCRDCGYVVNCPRCDTPMTYHRSGEAMRCHHCGYMMQPPTSCLECGSKRIKYFGAGTQHVEAEVQKVFPQARTLRWDADTASNPEMHEAILNQFINHEADIIIGTQMIAKGLDLPLVTLVGVVSADLGLALPDFRAAERGFQLLTQVAGRAGRGLRGGKVILQTYQPDHYAVRAAAYHDYQGFYATEIAYRRQMGYPPFRRFARIVCRFTSEIKAHQEAELAANQLRKQMTERGLSGSELIGPVPCFFQRIDRHYRWHVILRSPDPLVALRGISLRPGWHLDIDPVDLL